MKRPGITTTALPGDLVSPGGERTVGIRTLGIVIGNEVAKGLIDLWHGKLALALEVIAFGIFFLAIAFAQGRGAFHQAQVAPVLLGFVSYIFFHMQTNRFFWGLLGEIQSGTLEQMYLSPLPSWLLTLGLAVTAIVEAVLTSLLLYFLVNLVVPVTLLLRWAALLPLVLLIMSSAGYSLILGGLTLRFKRLETFKELLQAVVVLFGGVFVSLNHMPGWMATVARFLPITPGIEGLQQTLLAGSSLLALADDGTLWWLVGGALAYLGLGIIIFSWCERMAKRLGTLGQY